MQPAPHHRLLVVQRRRQHRHPSGLPQFPSATATVRSSPRRFVRFTAEPLKRRENYSCVIPISPISDARPPPARGLRLG